MKSTQQANVLLIEDNLSSALLYKSFLKYEPYQVEHADTGAKALEVIRRAPPHVALLDLVLPDMDGLEILKFVHTEQIPTLVIVVTGHGSVDVAVETMRSGAFDFIEKPFSKERLLVTLRNASEHQRLSRMLDSYAEEFGRSQFGAFVGASLPMQRVYRIIDSAAPSKATVFIIGESGTGKEICAEAIHQRSPRRDKPFIAFNCAAIPKDLMESEIFGHVKGAFTGALAERQGAASRANEGTLFLDEVCEMDLDLQSKLLRFVQTGTFQKVGGNKLEKVDVRFVCATNRDPMVEVEAGRFREDLYYRLHVIPIALPPLRERDDDVILIADKLLKSFAKEEGKAFIRFAPEIEQVLLNYEWPGNVRQLQNVVRNIVVLNNNEVVTPDMLPPPLDTLRTGGSAIGRPSRAVVQPENLPVPGEKSPIVPLWQVEKLAIEQAIVHCDGNIPKAASLLEISPSTVYRKRQAWKE